jgi:AraC-like DNA-binding protein
VELSEIAPGKFFRNLRRPMGAPEVFPFHVVFESADVVDTKSTHLVREHRHPHYEVIVIESGRYRFTLNGAAGEIGLGEVMICKPGDLHEDLCREAVRFRSVHFRMLPGPEAGRSFDLYADAPPFTAQVFADSEGLLLFLAKRMGDEVLSGGRFSAQLLDLLAAEFAWTLAHRLSDEHLNPKLLEAMPGRGFAGQLQQLFERHIGDQLSLRDMASALGMSERTLTSRCRESFGTSPTRLFVRHKMERARQLLVQTDLPIQELSAYLGFKNPYHFSTVYKRVHGVAPTGHR